MPATDPASDVWNESLLANPHTLADKRSRIQKMFAAIAPSYDLNNRLHSLWMDQRWRKKAVKLAQLKATDIVVDVACGTGDLALQFARRLWDVELKELVRRARDGSRLILRREAARVIGIDFTFEMLPIARAKAQRVFPPWLQPSGRVGRYLADKMWQMPDLLEEGRRILQERREKFFLWVNGDALCLPLPDDSANVLSIAFGIRNVQHPAAAIREFYRVLKPGGRLIILEFSLPTNRFLRALYNFYFTKILPRTATLISGDKTGAYKYLPQSVNTFISRESMQDMMRQAGFTQVEAHPLTFGICVCYRGVKA